MTPSSNTATITSADSTTVALGRSLAFKVTTSGNPAASITASDLPAGVKLKAHPHGVAILSGAPTAGPGVYTFTLTADNGTGPGYDQVFTLTDFGFTSSGTASFTVGTSGSFPVTTGPALAGTTVSAAPLSDHLVGLTLTPGPNGTATLAGDPAPGDTSATVTVRATDGSITVTQKLHVTIDG